MPKLFVFLMMITPSVFAGESFKLVDIYCSDFDQYYVGEACQLTLTQENREVTLLVDLYEFMSSFDRNVIIDSQVTVDLSSTSKCAPEAYYELRLYQDQICYNVESGKLSQVLK